MLISLPWFLSGICDDSVVFTGEKHMFFMTQILRE